MGKGHEPFTNMVANITADLLVLLHLAFIVFVMFEGFWF